MDTKILQTLDQQLRSVGLELRRVKTSVTSLRAFGSLDGNEGKDAVSLALVSELRSGLEKLQAHVGILAKTAEELSSQSEEK